MRDVAYFFYYWIRQLVPLTYRSRYKEKGKKYFVVWRMWLGRCFDIDRVQVR